MSKFLLVVFAVFFILTLAGCAVTSTKENPDICQQSADSIHRKFNRTTSIEKETINVETSDTTTFYDQTPVKVFSGIESTYLNDSYLTVNIIDTGLFEQYSAPIIKPTIKTQYEAHPFTGTFTPIGIFVWLFNPTAMNAFTFGCTEITYLTPEPDKTRKAKTGKSEWKTIPKGHRILVSGFDREYEFDFDASTSPKAIDLSSAISNTELTRNSTFKVTCLDCDLLGAEVHNLYKDSKTNIVLTHDFRPIKESMAESLKVRHAAEEGKKIKQVKRDKEEPKTRAAHLSKQPTVSKQEIESAKEMCTNLGFKSNTEKFYNCFKRLTE
ncbi:MAG: hypothetical protein HOP23_03940 [Methylococcaceae bacterium]|nr:hypothetical protein [Methylococcaceae bacterium]